MQFHPEVNHTQFGQQILEISYMAAVMHLAIGRCILLPKRQWRISAKSGQRKVLLALSGGVDSSVVAALMHQAIGKNPHLYFCGSWFDAQK